MTTLVVSDLHFGYSRSNKRDFGSFVKNYVVPNDFEEMVLLGDIFDFWRVEPLEALFDSITYLSPLMNKRMRLNYVVGNHDHRLTKYNIFQFASTEMGFNADMKVHYPFLHETIGERHFLFTHGHYFDRLKRMVTGNEARGYEVKESGRIVAEEALNNPREVEESLKGLYDFLYEMPKTKTSKVILDALLNAVEQDPLIWKMAGTFVEHCSSRVEETITPNVEKWFGRDVDCLVYGHTHIAGLTRRSEKRPGLVANTGSWVNEKFAYGHEPIQHHNTFIEIDGKKVGLYKWKDGRKEELENALLD